MIIFWSICSVIIEPINANSEAHNNNCFNFLFSHNQWYDVRRTYLFFRSWVLPFYRRLWAFPVLLSNIVSFVWLFLCWYFELKVSSKNVSVCIWNGQKIVKMELKQWDRRRKKKSSVSSRFIDRVAQKVGYIEEKENPQFSYMTESIRVHAMFCRGRYGVWVFVLVPVFNDSLFESTFIYQFFKFVQWLEKSSDIHFVAVFSHFDYNTAINMKTRIPLDGHIM